MIHTSDYTSVIAIKTIISGFCLGFDQGEIAAADAEESWHPYGAPWRWGELRWWFPRSREGGTDWRISGEVQYPPFNATEKQMAWKNTWNYFLRCEMMMCHIYVWGCRIIDLGLDRPFGFRSLWSVRCDQIWRMPPASFEIGDASMLPWPVQSGFPKNKSAKGVQHEHLDLLNKKSSQSWDGEKTCKRKIVVFFQRYQLL